jgi:hypothetical protein
MAQAMTDSVEAGSIEEWFFQSAVRAKDCSFESKPGRELCPGYYKALATAADWHFATIFFAVMLVCLFMGMAFGKKG